MLSSLKISNYALIDELEVEFGNGLTIVTGETGAGKSIILGALSLLLGQRADTRSVHNEGRKTIVEAQLTNLSAEIENYLQNEDLCGDDTDGTLILRREISPSGRSRAFVNDVPVTLSQLANISNRLIDIHSQHQNARIASADYRLSMIDSVGITDELLHNYKEAFNLYLQLRIEYRKLKNQKDRERENEEFERFRLEQLNALKPKRGEQQALEREYQFLSNSEDIRSHLVGVWELMRADVDDSAISKLQSAYGELQKVPDEIFEDSDSRILDRLNAALVELSDISATVSAKIANAENIDERLEAVNKRLNELYEAQMRFKVSDTDTLVDIHEELLSHMEKSDDSDFRLKELGRKLKEEGEVLKRYADELSEHREASAKQFSRELEKMTMPLGLPNLKFEIRITRGKLGQNGQDHVDFLCTFNKNQPMLPVEKVASGGELSRLMLSMKSLVAGKMDLPTLILDEIDTGVSGAIADKMGEMMRQASQGIQVMAITHLPQVAAKGDSHFVVYKEDTEERTVTHLRRLTSDERVEVIAGMLSGADVDNAALMNARALLKI